MVNVRNSLESLYVGRFNSYVQTKVTDPITYQTTEVETAELVNVPCRLSFSTISQTKFTYENMGVPQQQQVIKIFCSPDIVVSKGSILEVTQNGVTQRFTHSGVPAVHSNHQEIILEYEENYK